MDFLKTVTGKVVSGVVALVVMIGGITWWNMDQHTKDYLINGAGKIVGWFGVVLALPWATFFLIGRVGKLESNTAGGLLVFGYTLMELLLLCWLFNWKISGASSWTFVALGTLLAAVYNLFTCDWIAEKVT